MAAAGVWYPVGMLRERTRAQTRPRRPPARRARRASVVRRRVVLGLAAAVLFALGVRAAVDEPPEAERADPRGTPAWAVEHYGDPDAPGYKKRNIVAIDFLGRTVLVHRAARRHFLRLESLFAARAPEYAAAVALGELDDWSYLNRAIRGGIGKSSHAFGLAIDVNALTNVLGTAGDMPEEVVRQWEIEGGDWGGDWSRPDPMHFETHLTPEEIRRRYRRDGSPRPWFLEELTGG